MKGFKWFNLMKVAFIRDLFTIKHRFSYLIADIFHSVVFLCQNAMSLYWWFSLLTFFLLKAHDRDTGENRKINFKVIKVEFVGSEGTVPQDLFLYTDSKAQEDPDGRFFADIRWDKNISDAFGRSPCRETTWSSYVVCVQVSYQTCVVDGVQLTETNGHWSERKVHGGSWSL